ncbi:MAG: ATP-binding protein [Blastocatellia bacterium]|nr:ATP-binding protein [Blastocatellia bacterium]
MTIQTEDLNARLAHLGLRSTADGLDDLIARATRHQLSPFALIEEIVRLEIAGRTSRKTQRLLSAARIGRFKPMVDFNWNWPESIDRDLIERSLSLEFVREGRNLIMIGNNGLGKTMIAQNIASAAVTAGFSVLFRTASALLDDLGCCDSPQLRRRKLNFYARPQLIVIDELGYLSYDTHAADLLFEVVNRRYERSSLLLTTNKIFSNWNEIFPNAACITTLLDRLTHHADVAIIKGKSWRGHESEMEAEARRKSRKNSAKTSGK